MSITGRLGGPEAVSAEIIALDREHFSRPWTADEWSSLSSQRSLLFTWLRGASETLGFALFGYADGDDLVHLYKILLRPDCRGTGESEAFWSSIEAELLRHGFASVYLEVESNNSRAIRFYEREGFRLLRRNRSYYSDGQDALMMSLTLRAATL
jgi:ribosomal-protein-alanine N-acetyltransferase